MSDFGVGAVVCGLAVGVFFLAGEFGVSNVVDIVELRSHGIRTTGTALRTWSKTRIVSTTTSTTPETYDYTQVRFTDQEGATHVETVSGRHKPPSAVSLVYGPRVPPVVSYDKNERVYNAPMPLLFQWRRRLENRPVTETSLRGYLDHALTALGVKDTSGQPMRYTFHDFGRLFITDAIMHGMPPHIAQLVAGHRDINTTVDPAWQTSGRGKRLRCRVRLVTASLARRVRRRSSRAVRVAREGG